MKKISLQKNNKDKKMTCSAIATHPVALSSYLVGTHNTVYAVHSLPLRSLIFYSTAFRKTSHILNVIRNSKNIFLRVKKTIGFLKGE